MNTDLAFGHCTLQGIVAPESADICAIIFRGSKL